ncbi:transporter substrate-binding domain-containing protein [Paucibacter sp. AS339]|uniref:substrate-binding periplasmic protein n=1 Tax=Paucibacter hankyongi TaxID=3133434 RepID=UPI003095E948
MNKTCLHRRSLLLATALWAVATRVRANGRQTLLVEVGHNPPSVIAEGATVRGIFADFLRLVGQRCELDIQYRLLPRARVVRSFVEGGETSVLLPATRTSERDKVGLFMPMVTTSTLLVSMRKRQFELADTAALLQQTGRVALPRSYSWGDAYEQLVKQLEAQGRVDYVTDVPRVTERLINGLADFSLLPASFILGRLQSGGPHAPNRQAEDFAMTALQGLPPAQIGLYLSRQRVSEADRSRIRAAVAALVQDGSLQRLYLQYMPEPWVREHVNMDHSDAAVIALKAPR